MKSEPAALFIAAVTYRQPDLVCQRAGLGNRWPALGCELEPIEAALPAAIAVF